MATTFTWKIVQLDRETADGFVFQAYYRLVATDGVYSHKAVGDITFDRPETLVPYDDLTEEVVSGWVQEKLGSEKIEEVKAALETAISEKRNPTKASGLPWPPAQQV